MRAHDAVQGVETNAARVTFTRLFRFDHDVRQDQAILAQRGSY
jgi:hypothetical protein